MELKKNIFSYFIIALFLTGDLYILVSGISAINAGQEYHYASQGMVLLVFLGVWLALNLFTYLLCWFRAEDFIGKNKKAFQIVEIVMLALMAIAGIVVRELYVHYFRVQPEADFKTYYDIADLIKRKMLASDASGYVDYISVFPHTYGYTSVLSKLFAVFGTGVNVAQQFNIVLSMLSAGLVYLIGRLSLSRGSAIIAFCLACFWPSQIAYINMIAPEYLFSTLALGSIALFLFTLKRYGVKSKRPVFGVILTILVGVLLAFGAAVSPMAIVLLIAFVLCIIFSSFRLPVKKVIDQPISLVMLSQGWIRCILMILPFFIVTSMLTFSVEYAINRDVVNGFNSMNYNLMVGLNVDAGGKWNQEDADFLYSELEKTGDATLAQKECRRLAIERIRENPTRILNLLMNKYQIIWGSDEWGYSVNKDFLAGQGKLTEQTSYFLNTACRVNNYLYLVVIALAGVSGVFLWKKGEEKAYVFVMLFLCTAVMLMFVDIQGRYGFFSIMLMILLASEAVGNIYKHNRANVLASKVEEEKLEAIRQEERQKREDIRVEEEKLKNLRTEAMQCHFDMKYALEHNLIHVSVSDSYRTDNGLSMEEVNRQDNEKEKS